MKVGRIGAGQVVGGDGAGEKVKLYKTNTKVTLSKSLKAR